MLDNIRQAKKIIREVEGRGTTIELKIDGKYSIKSDGKPVKLEVGEAKLKSHPSFISVPSVSKSTYITSNIKNEASFPLLPGTLKIYIDGNFIGKSKIGFIAEGEEFEIYLGFEERIKVTRELNFKLSSGTFSAKKKRLKIAYTIRVKNYLNSRARIEVHDQIPISQKKEIKIRLLDHDPTAKTDNKGILKWSVQLEPGGEQTIKYAYQMDYPGDLNIQNMEQLEKRIKIKRVNEK